MQGPNYSGAATHFEIFRHGRLIANIVAQNRIYSVQNIVLSEAAIDAGVFCDLYIALGEPLENNAWGVRLYYKPFMRWIWGGGILMLLDGLLSFCSRRT